MKIAFLIFLLVLKCSSNNKLKSALPDDHFVFVDAKIRGGNVLATHKLLGSGAINYKMPICTNANWLSLSPIIEVQKDKFGTLFFEENVTKNVLKISKSLNLKNGHFIMLKPQISFASLGFDFWGDYKAKSEKEWKVIEKSFQKLLLAYAETSITCPQVKLLCLGNELFNFTKTRPLFFKETAILIKKKYPNLRLTYAANWDEIEHIEFWDHLDFIGVNAYFPLVNAATPSVESIKYAYEPIELKLRNLSMVYKKQVLFTEYGFRSIDYGAWKAWQLPAFYESQLQYNPQVQSNGYTAFYGTFWNKDWVAGGFFWVWDIISETDSSSQNELTYLNSDWTVNYKPVLEIIKECYSQ